MIGFRLPGNLPRVPTSICGEAGQRSADPTRKEPSIHSVREMSQRQTEPYGMTFCMGWHLATRQARKSATICQSGRSISCLKSTWKSCDQWSPDCPP